MDTTPNTVASPNPDRDTAASAPASENVNANPAPSAGAAPGEPAAQKPEDQQPKGPSRLQKRIDELTAQRYDEQRARQDAEARLAAIERQQKLTQHFSELDAQAPRVEHYQDLQSYQMAVSDWTTKRAAAVATAQWDERMQHFAAQQAQQQQRAMAEQQKVMRENVMLEERIGQGTKKYPDFMQVVQNPELPSVRGTHLWDTVMATENPVDVAYALAKKPGELDRLLSMDSARAAREVYALDSKFTGNGATQAPPPPPQRNGSTQAPKEWNGMSTKEHVEAYLRQKRPGSRRTP